MSNAFMRFIEEEDGLGTVEIVIIIAILVGIALIFRHSIIKFVTRIIDQVFGNERINNQIDSQSIIDNYTSQHP